MGEKKKPVECNINDPETKDQITYSPKKSINNCSVNEDHFSLKKDHYRKFKVTLNFTEADVSDDVFKDCARVEEISDKDVFTIDKEDSAPPKKRADSKRIIEARINFEKNIQSELIRLVNDYEDKELLYNTAVKVEKDAISQPNQFSIDDLPKWKLNSKYMAAAFIYYALRHTNYNNKHEKYKFYSITDYVKDHFPNNTTMSVALSTIVPLLYDFLSKEIDNILYYPKSRKYSVKEAVKERNKILLEDENSKNFNIVLKKKIDEVAQIFDEKTLICEITHKILKDAVSGPDPFSRQKILESTIRLTAPEHYSIALLFLAYNHEDFGKKKLNISSFSEIYFPNNINQSFSTIPFVYKFLSLEMRDKIKYSPKRRGGTRCIINIEKFWLIAEKFLQLFIDSEIEEYIDISKSLLSSAEQDGFDVENVNSQFLAATLVYYSLILNGDFDFISKNSFLNLLRSKFALENKVRKDISDFYPYVTNFAEKNRQNTSINESIRIFEELKRHENINRDIFREELLKIRENHKQNNRIDNVIVCDLLLYTLEFYNNFRLFVKDISFVRPSGSISNILNRLANENFLKRKAETEEFYRNFSNLIDRLKTSSENKEILMSLLNDFYSIRENEFISIKGQKKRRELERRTEYGDFFFSHIVRVRRFLLMLGFSPYDGYDIWSNNRAIINGKHIMFVDFHHIFYYPQEKSEKDLIFIPQKSPKKHRKHTGDFLSHSMIAGREGNLKRTDIYPETRKRIEDELKLIQEILIYNSNLLEKAVYTLNPKYILELKGWSEESKRKAIERLNDTSFSWAKDIEHFIPTAKGYEIEKINKNEVQNIIEEIISKRGSFFS